MNPRLKVQSNPAYSYSFSYLFLLQVLGRNMAPLKLHPPPPKKKNISGDCSVKGKLIILNPEISLQLRILQEENVKYSCDCLKHYDVAILAVLC
jgi:hypothetical protein